MNLTPMISLTALLVVVSVPASAAPAMGDSLMARMTVTNDHKNDIRTNVDTTRDGRTVISTEIKGGFESNIDNGGDDGKRKHHPKDRKKPTAVAPITDNPAGRKPVMPKNNDQAAGGDLASVSRLTRRLKYAVEFWASSNRLYPRSVLAAIAELGNEIQSATKNVKPDGKTASEEFTDIARTFDEMTTALGNTFASSTIAQMDSAREIPTSLDGLLGLFQSLETATKSKGFVKRMIQKVKWLAIEYQKRGKVLSKQASL